MDSIEDILNYKPFSASLVTSGQPEADCFPLIRSTGFQVLINLATDNSYHAIPQEAELVKKTGMQYFHIPVVWEAPQVEQFTQFSETLKQLKDTNTFVHCAMNWRVSCFMFLYRVIELQITPSEAWWDVLDIWQPEPTWKNFVQNVLKQNHITDFSFMQ